MTNPPTAERVPAPDEPIDDATFDRILDAVHQGHVGQVTIYCDECGVEETMDCTGATRDVRFEAARRHLATAKGWLTADDELDQDLCPPCREADAHEVLDATFADVEQGSARSS